jgi:hypothetical protein
MEMKMLDNGNYESVVAAIQHKCISPCLNWVCSELGWKLGVLNLESCFGDKYEDGCEHKVEVKFCPFCGYSPIDKI